MSNKTINHHSELPDVALTNSDQNCPLPESAEHGGEQPGWGKIPICLGGLGSMGVLHGGEHPGIFKFQSTLNGGGSWSSNGG